MTKFYEIIEKLPREEQERIAVAIATLPPEMQLYAWAAEVSEEFAAKFEREPVAARAR